MDFGLTHRIKKGEQLDAAPLFYSGKLANLADVGRRRTLGSLLDGELNRVTFLQRTETISHDG